MSSHVRAEKLQSLGIFKDIKNEILVELCQLGTLKNFQRGEVVFQGGNKTDKIVIILSGTVLVYEIQDSRKKFLTSLISNDILCEAVLFDQINVESFVECFEETELIFFPRLEILEFLRNFPDLFSSFMDRLLYRVMNPKHLIIENFDKLMHMQEQTQKESDLKSVFLGIVSHELKTPLTSIMAWPQMLKSCNYNLALVKKALDAINRNSLKLKEIIDDLLDFSSIENNKFAYNFGTHNPGDIVLEAIETVKPLSDKKRIEIEVKLAENLPLLRFDARRIGQVVSNLLVNAIKFSHQNSRIIVDAGLQKDYVEISVIDNGIGIESKNHEIIFEQFKQLEEADIRKYGGLGLGLPMAKKFLEDHKGSISVESSLGKGSKFTFSLPVNADAHSGL
ncbi:ATP-binding protein [Candidatus Riflebacteria bacterium]